MDKNKKAVPGGDGGHSAAVSRAQVVRLWEALFDEDTELARDLFFDALLRDARAEYKRKAKGQDDDDEEKEQRRLARVFQPWQPPAGPVATTKQEETAPATVERTLVLGLCAPPHMARKKDRHPASQGVKKKPRRVL